MIVPSQCGWARTIALLEVGGAEVADPAVAADPVVEDLDPLDARPRGISMRLNSAFASIF
jgi:hypothetical protein